MKPAVFLDRDGTINVEKNYTHKIEEFEFIDGSIDAIRLLNEQGFLVIVVTNQSGIGVGYYPESDVHIVHKFMQDELQKKGAHIDAIYYCPHHPKGKGKYKLDCNCRKPKIGMFEQARLQFTFDASQSWMIGDKLKDYKFGENCGLKSILVETGYGKDIKNKSVLRKKNLLEAVRYIMEYEA